MSNRNFILLIVTLIVISIFSLGYFLSYRPANQIEDSGGTNFLSQFNPFNGSSNPSQPTNTEGEPEFVEPGNTDSETPAAQPDLRKVSSMPISGYGVFKKERLKEEVIETPAVTTSTVSNIKKAPPAVELISAVRYVSRANGNIFQTFADKIDERKYTNSVIPKVQEAYFGNKAQTVVMRYLKPDEVTIDTFVGNIPKEVLGADTTATNEVKGTFLPENIKDVSLSFDNLKLFYLAPSSENVLGTVHNFVDGKKAQVFDSSFTEWLPQWPTAKMITLTTKPSANVPGHMYVVDPGVKKITRVFGDINGLTTLTSPNGRLVAYSGADLTLNLYEISTKSSRSLGLRTLPEKCVWNKAGATLYCAVPQSVPSALYPDEWYKGGVSFSDQIWKIDINTGNTELVADPVNIAGGVETDGIKLAVDEDEKYLFFVNKKDSFLWELVLN